VMKSLVCDHAILIIMLQKLVLSVGEITLLDIQMRANKHCVLMLLFSMLYKVA